MTAGSVYEELQAIITTEQSHNKVSRHLARGYGCSIRNSRNMLTVEKEESTGARWYTKRSNTTSW